MADDRTVFVVHGRNVPARNALFTFLRSIGLEWTQAIEITGKPAPMISEVLDAAFGTAQAIVVLLSGDDEVRLRPQFAVDEESDNERELLPQPRPNVLFEAGLALGRAPDRTVFVELGRVKPFSDNAGRHTVRLDGTTQSRQELASKLRLAGCAVDVTGTDWHEAGDFQSAIQATNAQSTRVDSYPPAPSLARAIIWGDSGASRVATSLEVSGTSLLQASDFTSRIVKRQSPYWRFGWQVTIKNTSRSASSYRLEFRFLDAEGHAVEHDTDHSEVVIPNGASKQLSGVILVDAEVSPSVRRVLLIVSPRTTA